MVIQPTKLYLPFISFVDREYLWLYLNSLLFRTLESNFSLDRIHFKSKSRPSPPTPGGVESGDLVIILSSLCHSIIPSMLIVRKYKIQKLFNFNLELELRSWWWWWWWRLQFQCVDCRVPEQSDRRSRRSLSQSSWRATRKRCGNIKVVKLRVMS